MLENNADKIRPENATNEVNFSVELRLSKPPFNAQKTRLNHNAPIKNPNSQIKLKWLLTRVLISMSLSNKNALAISPEFPSPTPIKFPAKSFNPASQMRMRFDADVSKSTRSKPPEIQRARIKKIPIIRKFLKYYFLKYKANTRSSKQKTSAPALDNVSESATINAIEKTAPKSLKSLCFAKNKIHENGDKAHMKAAAWFGL